MADLFLDDNNRALATADGLRPKPLAAGIISATLSGSTQELTIPTTALTQRGVAMLRIASGPQGALYAVGPAGAGASYTGIANMTYLPPNTVERIKITKNDASIYALQLGTAGTFQVSVLE